MNDHILPLIVEGEELAPKLHDEKLLLIDLSMAQTYVQYHIPGAVYLDYNWIVHVEKPRMGLLPDKTQLSNVLGAYGLTPDRHVVAYDDEGGGRACRLLWTLECLGHTKFSLVNGGIHAWVGAHHEVTSAITFPKPVEYVAHVHDDPVADRQFILDHMNHADTVIIDARSPQEYSGMKVFAARGGHIPGAINIEWTEAMDTQHQARLKPAQELKANLEKKGVTPDKTVICYCQTHHRSALTYIMLKSLGYKKIKGYPGSWSDWGNDMTTPVETALP